jgi:hypothetical protein
MAQTYNASSVLKQGYSQDKGGVLAQEAALQADLAVGQIKHVYAQLSATPGTVMSITGIPAWARYVKLMPDQLISFAIDETPAIDAADVGSGDAIAFGAAGVIGGIVDANLEEVRVITMGCTALKLVSGVASAKVRVIFSGG